MVTTPTLYTLDGWFLLEMTLELVHEKNPKAFAHFLHLPTLAKSSRKTHGDPFILLALSLVYRRSIDDLANQTIGDDDPFVDAVNGIFPGQEIKKNTLGLTIPTCLLEIN